MGNNYLNDNKLSSIQHISEEYTENCNIVKSYEAVTDFLGFHFIEAGKTMGLASYGKPNDRFDNIFVNGTGSRDFFKPCFRFVLYEKPYFICFFISPPLANTPSGFEVCGLILIFLSNNSDP
jgi:hypothetical protein